MDTLLTVSPQSFYYLALAGFLVTLGLLFHLVEKFREAGYPPETEQETALVTGTDDGSPSLQPELAKTETTISNITSEIDGFKNRIGELKSMVDNRRSLHENQINAIIENINNLVGKLETVEPSEVEKIQPGIQTLLDELETLRLPAAHDAENAVKK